MAQAPKAATYTGKNDDVGWFRDMKTRQQQFMLDAQAAKRKRDADDAAALASAQAAGVEARSMMGRTLQLSATMRTARDAAAGAEDALSDSLQGDPETSLGLAGERKLKPRANKFAIGSRVGVNI